MAKTKKDKKLRQPPKNPVARFFYDLFTKKPTAALGLIILVLVLLVAAFADVIAPTKMVDGSLYGNILEKLQPPSAEHWFGTDTIGRDLFSYMVYGARTSVVIALLCTVITMVVALVIGVTSAVIGGWFDLLVQRFVDAWQCIPSMLIMIIMMAMLGNGVLQMVAVLSVPAGVTLSRLFRSTAISVKDSVYMKTSKMLGSGVVWRMIRHVLPNIMPLVLMSFAGSIGATLMSEATLSFLGYGVSVSTPDWGAMLTGSGRSNMYLAPWLALIPGLAIALVVFAAAMLGDGVRDLTDPKLKNGVANYTPRRRRPWLDNQPAAPKTDGDQASAPDSDPSASPE